MIATGWKAATYGIRVGKSSAREYFSRNWKDIHVEIDGQFHTFNLTRTFWTTCPEFRGAIIGDWLKRNRLASWPKGKPPKVELIPVKDNYFKLMLLKPADIKSLVES